MKKSVIILVVCLFLLGGCTKHSFSPDIRTNQHRVNIERHHQRGHGDHKTFGEPHCPPGYSTKGWC